MTWKMALHMFLLMTAFNYIDTTPLVNDINPSSTNDEFSRRDGGPLF